MYVRFGTSTTRTFGKAPDPGIALGGDDIFLKPHYPGALGMGLERDGQQPCPRLGPEKQLGHEVTVIVRKAGAAFLRETLHLHVVVGEFGRQGIVEKVVAVRMP